MPICGPLKWFRSIPKSSAEIILLFSVKLDRMGPKDNHNKPVIWNNTNGGRRKRFQGSALSSKKGTMLIDVMIGVYILAVVGAIYAATVGYGPSPRPKPTSLQKPRS